MEASLSSKVTVEYHDPSGIFPLISRDLAAKLPLRNLNWKSPTRPLRSIGALHVEFVPDAATVAQTEKAQSQRADLSGPGGLAKGNEASGAVGKERRHQIPGLLQTPYLKIYLLRCDDKDIYKASSRQLLRDWIREQAPPPPGSSTQSNKTTNYDACEWLILHVVIPDTTAASEPRWSVASGKDTDELIERPQSTTKWPGKSTRTVLDKIRADFNATGKSALERVAQLRLQKKDVPPELLPPVPVPSQYTEPPQEQDNAWQDLIAKFKTMILMSFDLRVMQYEDDIKEKDAQRALPGWNFCTFFTLKEGLARGFESVGLVEDALAMYDELSAGLETQSTFLGDLDSYRDALQQVSGSDEQRTDELLEPLRDLLDQPLDLTKKDYRGEIVKNTISLFDFHLYIFARQRTLLLRLGSGIGVNNQKRPSSSQGGTSKDDLLTFHAEVCKRAAAFAGSNARTLRNALEAGPESESKSENKDKASSPQTPALIENLSSSWVYAVLEQILAETDQDRFPGAKPNNDGLSAPSQKPTSGGVVSRKEAFNFPQGANTHPTRTTSIKRSLSGSSSSAPPPQVIYENEKYSKPNATSFGPVAAQPGSGMANLAAGRADLLMMQRKVLETVAKRKGWVTGWAALVRRDNFSDVDLNDEAVDDETTPETSDSENHTELLLCSALASPMASLQDFGSAYEQLSNLALSHYNIANHVKSSEMITSDLAIVKYQLGDYAQAATLFQKSSPSYLHGSWTYLHSEMLRAYAKCLKELHRRDEYMRVQLSLLTKVIVRQRERSLPRLNASKKEYASAWLDDEAIDVSGVLDQVVEYSSDMPYNFTAMMSDFYGDIHVDQEVIHYDDKDGFSLNAQFRHLLEEPLKLDRVRLRLSNARESGQEIWLQSQGHVDLERGLIKLTLHSNINTYGVYLIDKLVLETNKLHFVHEFQPKPKQTPLGITHVSSNDQKQASSGPSISVYPHGKAFEVRTSLTKKIHIDQLRSVILDIDTGHNDIESLDLRLRGASAGLRLHTADATVLEDEIELDTSQGGLLRTGAVATNKSVRISLPYSIEHSRSEISIKIEGQYTTSNGVFVFTTTSTIPIELPLDVDVHDIFKATTLFSRFSIRTTSSIPLQISDVRLQDSSAYAVRALPCPPAMVVFEKQPASLTYQITKKSLEADTEIAKKDAALAMTVHYIRVDETILDNITSSLEQELENSPYNHFKRLLIPLLRSGSQSHSLALQFERAILFQKIIIPTYSTIGWDSAISKLPASSRDGLGEWLREWHKKNTQMSLNTTATPSPHEITITVDVPNISVIHTAKLVLKPTPAVPTPTATTTTAVLGTPILATLKLTHTRRWGSASFDDPLNFVYTLQAPSDVWLVGGQRKTHFTFITSSETEEKTFSIILIPLKTGTWLLPTIDIASVAATEIEKRSSGLWQAKRNSKEFTEGGNGSELVSCEVDYKSSGREVVVIRDVRTTSVNVGEAKAGGGAAGEGRASIERASLDSRGTRVMG